jgi:tRNA(Ile)-lysidine synthase
MMAPAGASPVPPEPLALGDERVARFAAGLARLWPGAAAQPDLRLGIAVSGGPDSCALLLLAAAALPGSIEAATVDHGLRRESGDEARFVSELCAVLGIAHATLPVVLDAGNIQAQARVARYGALGEWAAARGLAAIATGHHADDQAETLLLRLNRASGVAGLAGARERGRVPGCAVPVIRPLLDWRRAELAEVVLAARVAAVADPSNSDTRFDRVRMRKALAAADWLDPQAIAQSAAHLADADEALDWAAWREWDELVRQQPFGLVYRPRAPRAVALRVIARIVRELGCEKARGGQIAALFEALLAGSPASIGDLVARAERDGWTFSAAPVRRASNSSPDKPPDKPKP